MRCLRWFGHKKQIRVVLDSSPLRGSQKKLVLCRMHRLKKKQPLSFHFPTSRKQPIPSCLLCGQMLSFLPAFSLQLFSSLQRKEKRNISIPWEDCSCAGWAAAWIYIGTCNFICKVLPFSPMHVEEWNSRPHSREEDDPSAAPRLQQQSQAMRARMTSAGMWETDLHSWLVAKRIRGRSRGGTRC